MVGAVQDTGEDNSSPRSSTPDITFLIPADSMSPPPPSEMAKNIGQTEKRKASTSPPLSPGFSHAHASKKQKISGSDPCLLGPGKQENDKAGTGIESSSTSSKVKTQDTGSKRANKQASDEPPFLLIMGTVDTIVYTPPKQKCLRVKERLESLTLATSQPPTSSASTIDDRQDISTHKLGMAINTSILEPNIPHENDMQVLGIQLDGPPLHSSQSADQERTDHEASNGATMEKVIEKGADEIMGLFLSATEGLKSIGGEMLEKGTQTLNNEIIIRPTGGLTTITRHTPAPASTVYALKKELSVLKDKLVVKEQNEIWMLNRVKTLQDALERLREETRAWEEEREVLRKSMRRLHPSQ